MTKLSETKCSMCEGTGDQYLTHGPVYHISVCPMCNGKGYEKETVGGYAPVASINHEGR